jgi:HEAT repeat protein
MSAPSSLAANLASMIFLLRDRPAASEEQVTAFRILLASIGLSGARLQVERGGLRIDGTLVPDGTPGIAELREQLSAHGVRELRIPATLPSPALLSLLRALAAQRGTFASIDRLVAAVDLEAREAVYLSPDPGAASSADGTGAESLQGENDRTAFLSREKLPAEDETFLGKDAQNEENVGVMHFVTIEQKALGRLDELLRALEEHPADPQTPDRLNEVVACGDMAVQEENWGDLMRTVLTLARSEERVPAGGHGRSFSIAIRRLMPRSVLEQIGRLVITPAQRPDAVAVLRRAGADGTEVLLALLASASTIAERRAFYGALRQMTEGTQLLINMLSHDEWYVVRNVADLCGELRLEEAVPALGRHLKHPDERVRRSIAGALARIASPPTTEPMRQALRDPAPTVRLQAVQGIDGYRSRGLTMTLAVLLDEESHPDLQREILLALGRIGTPEAVQALQRAASPGRRLFSRKPLAIRLGAVEGLQFAGGALAMQTLQGLSADDDSEVRAAAKHALSRLDAHGAQTPKA